MSSIGMLERKTRLSKPSVSVTGTLSIVSHLWLRKQKVPSLWLGVLAGSGTSSSSGQDAVKIYNGDYIIQRDGLQQQIVPHSKGNRGVGTSDRSLTTEVRGLHPIQDGGHIQGPCLHKERR